MEVAIVLSSHRGRAAKLAVVLGVLTKPAAAHNPVLPPNHRPSPSHRDGLQRRLLRIRMLHPNDRKTGRYWRPGWPQTMSSHSQATEVVEEKSVTITTTGELRKYMSERAMDFGTTTAQPTMMRSGAPEPALSLDGWPTQASFAWVGIFVTDSLTIPTVVFARTAAGTAMIPTGTCSGTASVRTRTMCTGLRRLACRTRSSSRLRSASAITSENPHPSKGSLGGPPVGFYRCH